MKRFGLIGNPISHSLSPALFKAAYPDSDMRYDLIHASTSAEALSLFKKEYDAINVTAPFKEDAFLFADMADEITTSIGASNLLVNEGGSVKAYNSDCLAVAAIIRNLVNMGRLDNSVDRIVVVGCGGAGKAAAYASSLCGFKTEVLNRNFDKAQQFCTNHNLMEAFPLSCVSSLTSPTKLIIYTAPSYLPEIGILLDQKTTLLEANYREPSFETACRTVGAEYISGKEWLIEQAVSGFRIMTGKEPDELKIRTRLQ